VLLVFVPLPEPEPAFVPLPEPVPELVPLPAPIPAMFVDSAPTLETIVVGKVVVITTVESPEIIVLVTIVEVEKVDKPPMTIPTLPNTGEDCEAATENETPMLCAPAAIVLAEASKGDDLKESLLVDHKVEAKRGNMCAYAGVTLAESDEVVPELEAEPGSEDELGAFAELDDKLDGPDAELAVV